VRRSGGRRDGCATFWRAQRLHATHVRRIKFHDHDLSDNVALLVALQPLEEETVSDQQQQQLQQQLQQQEDEGTSGGSTSTAAGGDDEPDGNVGLLVANTHIIFAPERGDVKLGQVRTLVQAAADMAQVLASDSPEYCAADFSSPTSPDPATDGTGARTNPTQQQQRQRQQQRRRLECSRPRRHGVIVCGDFNALPGSPVYDFVIKGQLDLSTVNRRSVTGFKGQKGYKGLRRGGGAGQQGVLVPLLPQQQQQQQQQRELTGAAVAALQLEDGAAAAPSDGNAAAGATPAAARQAAGSAAKAGALLSRAAGAVAGAAGALMERIGSGSASSGLAASAEWLEGLVGSPGVHRWSEKELRRAAGPEVIPVARDRRSLERDSRQQQQQGTGLSEAGQQRVEGSSTNGAAAGGGGAGGLDASGACLDRPAAAGGVESGQSPAAAWSSSALYAGATAANAAATAAADGSFGATGDGTGSGAAEPPPVDGSSSSGSKQKQPLIMRHPLNLRSSYLDVLGECAERSLLLCSWPCIATAAAALPCCCCCR